MSQSELIGTSTATGIDYNKVLVNTTGQISVISHTPINADNTGMIYNNSTIADGASSGNIDLNGYRAIRIWGNTAGTLIIEANNTNNAGNAGFYDSFDDIAVGTIHKYYPDPPRVIRIINNSGGSIAGLNLVIAKYK